MDEPKTAPATEPKKVVEVPKTVNVTWLGQGEHGPNQITQWNTSFTKDKPVEITDPSIWTRAQADPFFKVEITDKPKPAEHGKAAEPAPHGKPTEHSTSKK